MRNTFRQLGIDTGYLLSSFPVAIPAFVITIAGFAAGVGTAVIGLGLMILVVTLHAGRGFAAFGRANLSAVLRRPVAKPRHKHPRADAGPVRRFLTPLTDGQSWLNLLWVVVHFPIAVTTFVITIVWWVTSVAALAYPLYGWIIERAVPDSENQPFAYATEWLGWGDSYLATTGLGFLGGLIMALLLMPLIRGLALTQAMIGKGMLTSLGGLQERIDDLTMSRDAATAVEVDALRRIERDIHDGPQQQLVSLGMELSRVRRQMSRDPKAAQATLDEAITQTSETIGELRALSRGIAPPILTDRGLEGAMAALAARSAVPVHLSVNAPDRYSPKVENTVYFVVAEALTNVAKHSGATRATVRVEPRGDSLRVSIADNGVGGASVDKGHGLAGLADRLKAAEGDWIIDSPEGGPTVILAEVPIGE